MLRVRTKRRRSGKRFLRPRRDFSVERAESRGRKTRSQRAHERSRQTRCRKAVHSLQKSVRDLAFDLFSDEKFKWAESQVASRMGKSSHSPHPRAVPIRTFNTCLRRRIETFRKLQTDLCEKSETLLTRVSLSHLNPRDRKRGRRVESVEHSQRTRYIAR